jgi:hypothetical protein
MTNAICFETTPDSASLGSLPCNEASAPSRILIPNASTHGPPTSSAVQINHGNFMAGCFTEKFPANRVRDATVSGYAGVFMASAGISVNRLAARVLMDGEPEATPEQ